MCEMVGSKPIDSEIPCERGDLTTDTQLVLSIYDKLPSRWEGFSGQYLGKDMSILTSLFDHYKMEHYLINYAWEVIPLIDSFVAEDIAKKLKAKTKVGDMPGGR